MPNPIGLAGVLALLPSVVLASAAPQPLAELSLDELMQIEITSVSKKSEQLSQAAAAVYVVTQDEIRRSGATSIPEALRLVPGVDVAQIDPNKWAVGIRGFNERFANKLLVLLDGRSVYTPTFSGVYWENLDYLLEDIERIEVIRGPGATLWGANAVNGIINIITRDAADTQGGLLSLAAGNELQGLVGVRQGGALSEQVQGRVYVKGRKLDEGQDLAGQVQDNGGDYLQTGFRLDWQRTAEQWLSFQGNLYRNEMGQEHGLPDFQPPYLNYLVADQVESEGVNLALRWSRLTGLDSELTAQLYYDYYDRQEVKYDERRDTFDVELQHQFSPLQHHELVWGAGYRWSDSDIPYGKQVSFSTPSKRSKIWNLFIQDEIRFPALDLAITVGTKVEGNSYTGTEVQPNLRASWVPNDQLTWWGALSRARRTPSQADIDSSFYINTWPPFAPDPTNPLPSVIQVVGQPDFEAEQLDAYELGVRWMPVPELALDLTAFFNDYDNLRSYDMGEVSMTMIDGQPFVVVPLLLSNNIQGHSSGLELLATWQATERSRFRLAYSLLDMDLEDTEHNDFSSELISLTVDRVPEQQASLWGSFDLGPRLELDVRLFYVSQRTWSTTQIMHIDSNFNGDLRLGWRPAENLELSLVGRNLLDSARQEFMAEAWPSPSEIERSVFVRATLQW